MAAQSLEMAANFYAASNGGCPTLEQVLTTVSIRHREDFIDPWGTPLALSCTSEGLLLAISAGPDRRFGTADDLNTDKPQRWPLESE